MTIWLCGRIILATSLIQQKVNLFSTTHTNNTAINTLIVCVCVCSQSSAFTAHAGFFFISCFYLLFLFNMQHSRLIVFLRGKRVKFSFLLYSFKMTSSI